MREIKFRAWNGEEMIFPTSIMQGGTACWRENSVIETSNDVMFYTGFKSKNGEEIYEHDVILLKDKDYDEKNETAQALGTYEFHCVVFEDGCFKIGGVNLGDFIDSKYLDIVHCGNIYENKEVYRVEEKVLSHCIVTGKQIGRAHV